MSSAASGLTIELGKMLALVAPSSMTLEQQEIWLCAAVDALQDIRPAEVAEISAEVRRSVTRHNQIVPAITDRVAELRKRRSEAKTRAALPPLAPQPERAPPPPLTQAEVDRMPKWIKDMGLRVGFLKREGGRIVATN
jgi:hypothetical protein